MSIIHEYLKKILPTATMQLVAGLTLLLITLAKYLPEQIHSVWPELKVPEMLISQICLSTIILFLGTFIILILFLVYVKNLKADLLSTYIEPIKKDFDMAVFENRKERIKSWRERLNKFNTIKAFYKTTLYNELSIYIPDKERDALFKNYKRVQGRVLDGEIVGEDVNKRIITRFHKAISDKEKEWGLI